jgi:hypothetical protein
LEKKKLYILCISSVIYNFHGYYHKTKKFIPEFVGLSEQGASRTSERANYLEAAHVLQKDVKYSHPHPKL